MNKNHVLTICQQNCAQVTPLREMVLDLLLQYNGVVKAYQLLSDMKAIRENVAPPTVYRALDFWVEQGVLHKTEALNGYVLCQHLAQHQCSGVILHCTHCQQIFEECHTDTLELFKEELTNKGFKVQMQQIALKGICRTCQSKK